MPRDALRSNSTSTDQHANVPRGCQQHHRTHKKSHLVQFRAHRGLQGSHIEGHIVYFYNVWEDGDEEMGPVTGLVHRRVSREGGQSAVGGVHRGTTESMGTVAQGASPTHWDRAHRC